MIYAFIFVMMLMQFIGLAYCLKRITRALMVFYLVLVFVMFVVQMYLFEADSCSTETPVIYIWLLIQVGLFYFIVAYGLAAWGSYLCWDAEKEEALA